MDDRPKTSQAGEGDGASDIIRTGLIGMDIQGSRSPAMHMGEAAAQGILLDYALFDLSLDRGISGDLAATLDRVRAAGFAGVNITHPFKQRVMAMLDTVSDDAWAIGAVNTVVFRDGISTGYNTDSAGFAESFDRQLGGVALDRAVQFGAGGAGAATAMAMLQLGCRDLVIVDSQIDRAVELVARLPEGRARTLTGTIADALAAADGIVNATPIGMEGHPGSPVDPALLRPAMWVAEIVYFPIETELLQAARRIGCRTAHGGEMAVFQAAAAYDLFTGGHADRQRMIANF